MLISKDSRIKKLEVVKVEITIAPKDFEHISREEAKKAYDDVMAEPFENVYDGLSEDEAISMEKVAIFGALALYLDFINLFLMLLEFFGNSRN